MNTFMYVINNGGVDKDKEYPYGGRVGIVHCALNQHTAVDSKPLSSTESSNIRSYY